MEIWHLRHSDIHKGRWDRALRQAHNARLYAYSWYLDTVSPGWEALVNHDYSYIMPLPVRKKWGIDYIFQPILSQQLGVFTNQELHAGIINEFTDAIPKKYRLIRMPLNGNYAEGGPAFKVKTHTNFELDLLRVHSLIASDFSQNTRRNIRKAAENGLVYHPQVSLPDFLTLLQTDQSKGTSILLSAKNRDTFSALASVLTEKEAAIIPGVYDQHGLLVAAVLMGKVNQRYYYLAPAQHPEGKILLGLFFLIDSFIKEKSGKAGILDFEGSDIPGLARFYEGFGARPSAYQSLYINRLNPVMQNILLLLRPNAK